MSSDNSDIVLTMDITNRIESIKGVRLKRGVPLAGYTTLRIGGPAEILVEAVEEQSLVEVLIMCLRHGVPVRLMGEGSNILVADEGLEGVTIVNRVARIAWLQEGSVAVSGGFSLDEFVRSAADIGWQGLEFAAGIPGSVGGGLVGGAGAFGSLLADFLLSATIIDTRGGICELSAGDLGISYRHSEARDRGDIILEARFQGLRRRNPQAIHTEIDRIKRERTSKHPGPDLPSAGSFFKNLPPERPGGFRVPAGKYLDEAGVKGLRIGDAQVFERHANIIVNRGHATADDVNRLADEMATRVKMMHGIDLVREVLYWK